MTASSSTAHWRRERVVAYATLAAFLLPFSTLFAQQTSRDSTRADSTRARQLEREFSSFDEETREAAKAELCILDRRMTVVNLSLSACTAAALFVCVLVAMLFLADIADFGFGRPIAWLFVLAMLLLILGLILFLWEVRLAMQALRLRRESMPHRRP